MKVYLSRGTPLIVKILVATALVAGVGFILYLSLNTLFENARNSAVSFGVNANNAYNNIVSNIGGTDAMESLTDIIGKLTDDGVNPEEYAGSIIASFAELRCVRDIVGNAEDGSDALRIVEGEGLKTRVALSEELEADGKIAVLNVGLGDCTVVCSRGTAVMIDTGAGTEENMETISSALSFLGVEKLEYVILTHPHADRYGNLVSVLALTGCEKVIVPDVWVNDYGYRAAMSYCEESGVEILHPGIDEDYTAGNISIHVFRPEEGFETGYVNDKSLFVKITVKNEDSGAAVSDESGLKAVSMMISGDAGFAAEVALLERLRKEERLDELRADVLLVPEHGSVWAGGVSYMRTVNPQYAVISTGGNDGNYPHTMTVKKIEDMGFAPYSEETFEIGYGEQAKSGALRYFRTDETLGWFGYVKNGCLAVMTGNDLKENE